MGSLGNWNLYFWMENTLFAKSKSRRNFMVREVSLGREWTAGGGGLWEPLWRLPTTHLTVSPSTVLSLCPETQSFPPTQPALGEYFLLLPFPTSPPILFDLRITKIYVSLYSLFKLFITLNSHFSVHIVCYLCVRVLTT